MAPASSPESVAMLNREQSTGSGRPLHRVEWEDSPLSPLSLATKRALDILISFFVLVACMPVLLLAAAAIKLESPGPVLFVQTRVGYRGRKFQIFKLRSMFSNAEELRMSLMHLNEASGPVFKIKNDPRITKVGRLLRKLSLDELPQLINVIMGDISLVGPRPPLPCEVAAYTADQWKRLSVKPGITCLWQISGRSDIPFEQWVQLDVDYIRRQSLWLDLKILALTVPAVVEGRGAH